MQNSLLTHKFLWWKIQNLQIALQFFQTEPKSHRMLFIFVVALIQALSSFYPLFPKNFILECILKQDSDYAGLSSRGQKSCTEDNPRQSCINPVLILQEYA